MSLDAGFDLYSYALVDIWFLLPGLWPLCFKSSGVLVTTMDIWTEPGLLLLLELGLLSIENVRRKELVGHLHFWCNNLACTIVDSWSPITPAWSSWGASLILSIIRGTFTELLRLLLLSSVVLLLLIQVVKVHLLLHFNIFLVYSVDLLSQVLMLSLESFN